MRKACEGCIYYRKIAPHSEKCCHYMLYTGEKRNSPAGKKCNKRKEKWGDLAVDNHLIK